MKTSISKIPILSILMIFIAVSIGAAWNTDYFVVDSISFKLNLVTPLLSIIALSMVMYESRKPSTEFAISLSQLLLLIYFLFGTFSFIWAEDNWIFYEKWIIIFAGLFIFYLANKIEHNEKSFLNIATILSVSAFLVSIIGISQYLFSFPDFDLLQYNNIPASTFGNKNAANQFLVFLFPFTLYLTFFNRIRIYQIIGLISLVTLIFYMLYSVTKGAWIAVTIESIVFLFFAFLKPLRSKIFFDKKIIFLLVIFVSFFLVLQSFSGKQPTSSFENSFNTVKERYENYDSPRWEIWRSVPTIIEDSPYIGHGLGNYNHLSVNQGIHQKLQRVHNDFLELFVELGYFGVSIFIFLMFALIRDFYLIYKNSFVSTAFFTAPILALMGSFIHMMVSWPYQTVHGVIAGALMLSLIIKESKKYQKSFLQFRFDTKKIIIIFAIFSFFIFSFSSYKTKTWSDAVSEFYVNSGTQGSIFNYEKLKDASTRLLRKDLKVLNIASEFWREDHPNRSIEIYTLASDNNTLALYRVFIFLLDNNKIDESKAVLEKMQLKSKNNPLTFAATMTFYRKTQDMKAAKDAYFDFKNYVLNRSSFDFRAYLYLHQWSISLQLYEDTEKLYEILRSNWKIADHVETKMVNFYVYTNQHEKALPHLKYVLEQNPDLVNPIVLKALIDKGLVKLSNGSKS